ncbi:hypothetical protein HK101_011677 [Irineochytrium annulatum]|nr:hypothetical protein HK101_011677 [Irineochytrium annulatum]
MTSLTGKAFVTECLSPLVAVIASPDAEEAIQANKLRSVVDFLRPFGAQIEGRGLMVTSTANPDPLNYLKDLYPPADLPPVFERGFIDPQIPVKHYLLVHDASRAPAVE